MAFREAFGDVFEMSGDLLCVLTNLRVNARGRAVMGGGQAAAVRNLFPGVDRVLGEGIRAGKRFHLLGAFRRQDFGVLVNLAAFPTKEHWADLSTLDLIEESSRALMAALDRTGFENVLLPRPGCGLGGLDWESQVKPLVSRILDDRVIIVDFAKELRS